MEKLKKQINKVIPNKKEMIENYISSFDKSFNTDLKDKLKDNPILINLFETLIFEYYKPSKFYKYVLHEIIKLEDEEEKILSEQQKVLNEKLKYLNHLLSCDELQQMFIYGFCYCYQLKEELNKSKL